LHEFWDRVLVEERLAASPPEPPAAQAGDSRAWQPADAIAWTEESHALVLTAAYPPGTVIADVFADRSWSLVQSQWPKAARRLAAILDTVLPAEDPAACD
jgi:hypothetical protein